MVARLAGFLEFLEISSSNNKVSKSMWESPNDIRPGPESKTSSIFSLASSTQRATNNINGAARRCKLMKYKTILHSFTHNHLCAYFYLIFLICVYNLKNKQFLDHIRNNSEASPDGFETYNIESESEFRISSLHSTRAHQQPITCLVVEVGIVVTGSQVCLF